VANRNIIYIWDPLCSWCYGFTPVIHDLRKKFELDFNFELISGGLATGEKIKPISEKAEYIKKKLPDIERIGGVKFGEKYIHLLEAGTYITDSLPPALAFNVLRSFRADLAFEIAFQIHSAHFQEGKDLNNIKVYLEISEKFEINKHGFMERYEDPAYRKLTEGDFNITHSWGIEKYPTLIIKNENGIDVICKGYTAYLEIEKGIHDRMYKN
jgi:putative protein-disulfide isomerase